MKPSMSPPDADELIDRMHACWIGKNVGGTLGMPAEGRVGPLCLSGYDPVPEKPAANDDLDLQLLWLVTLESRGFDELLDSLAEAWVNYQQFEVDEYAVALGNLRRGIRPPMSGHHDNWFRHGMGAAIRSEIWACLFPGRPELAARFAHLDACVDHSGEGIEAEKVLAALQSIAFTTNDPKVALVRAMDFIDPRSKLRAAAAMVLEGRANHLPAEAMREQLNRAFGHHNFTDCVMNLAFIFFALVYGEGDFDRTVLLAVNCGQDTDCTGATAGATVGILRGTKAIGDHWTGPIGHDIVASGYLKTLPMPADIEELTRRVMTLSNHWLHQGEPRPELPADAANLPAMDDGHQLRAMFFQQLDFTCHPPAVQAAIKRPADDGENVIGSPDLHVRVGPHRPDWADSAYVLTWLTPRREERAFLMVCADAGLTVWVDGDMAINYHGRRAPVPAGHRTEGGANIPIQLRAGSPMCIMVRLLGVSETTRLHLRLTNPLGGFIAHPPLRAGK